jgi:two-component system CheB/CheR fusion protein
MHKKMPPYPEGSQSLQKSCCCCVPRRARLRALQKKHLFRRLERACICTDGKPGAILYFLQENPQEVQVLLKEFLIGVTLFFRDYPAFQVLEEKILPSS